MYADTVANLARRNLELSLKQAVQTTHVAAAGSYRKTLVRIRLRRMGAKGRPFYRVVVADQKAARDGSFVEQIGTYDPFPDPPAVNIDEERALHWLRHGAQPSDAVRHMLSKLGVMERVKAVG